MNKAGLKNTTSENQTDTRVSQDLTVVGIGASAGSLKACRELIQQLPGGSVCYVICQHLSPNHKSMLTNILKKDSHFPVIKISSGMILKPENIYITPPNYNLTISGNTLILTQPDGKGKPKPNINKFFTSLAEAKGERAIAIILSGTGSDGAIGMAQIKSHGGVTLVQEPKTSVYDGMPKSAIATHTVDHIDNVDGIVSILNRLINDGCELPEPESQTSCYTKILKLISTTTNIDFSSYKHTTINRRLKRRMSIKRVHQLEDYLNLIKSDSAEIWAFVHDAFIIVSEYYRDKHAFASLETQLKKKLKNHPATEEFRIWVPGCATGEEAFTLAMIMEDILTTQNIVVNYTIFASDISKNAIKSARNAIYTKEQVRQAPKDWIDKYLLTKNDHFIVQKKIRDKVIFSVHNILSDPPFSRINFISCRNLLIYFNDELQTEVIRLFHYALKSKGILFLGLSETIRERNLFDDINERYKISIRNDVKNVKPSILPFKAVDESISPTKKTYSIQDEIEKTIYKFIANQYGIAEVVVDTQNTIMFYHGKTDLLLQDKPGFASDNIIERIRVEFRSELRALLFSAKRLVEPAYGVRRTKVVNNIKKHIQLVVRPINHEYSSMLCVCYEESSDTSSDDEKPSSAGKNSILQELEHELSATRENLQTVVEELETANEQLQSYNEELKSTNEEYQSTNEELQTVNEELQSTNEELIIVNEELNEKNALQERLTNDLNNIQEAIELPLFITGIDFRLKRYTDNCIKLVDIESIKINDILFGLPWKGDLTGLRELVESMSDTLKPVKKEFVVEDRYYLCQVSPYLNSLDEFKGYAIAFYDTTSYKIAQLELNHQRMIAQTTLETISDGVIRVNDKLLVKYINPAVTHITHWSIDEYINEPISKHFKVYNGNQEIDIEAGIINTMENAEVYRSTNKPLVLKTRYGEDIYIEFSVSPIPDESNQPPGAVIAFRDVTEHRSKLNELEWSSKHDALTGLVNRNEMENRIDRAILSAKRDNIESSLLYLDLDQFKVVNDTCGHLAGDRLLKQIAQLLGEKLRSRDTLARLGGDEFSILLDKCKVIEAESVAKKIQQDITDYRFVWEDKIFRVGVSIGIVSINNLTNQVAEVLSNADAACYVAKDLGRNRIQVHSDDDDLLELQRNHMRSVSEITEAIEQEDFRLYFQEIQSLDNNESSQWEVLIRMFNNKGEFLLPGSFLPGAERFGLITRIDLWVVNHLLNNMHKYLTNKQGSFPNLNINISASTIGDDHYIDTLSKLIDTFQIDPSLLCFEITETAAISNYVKSRTFMSKMKDMGCRFALDDFGTGMSSLSYLRDLPIDTVKIDASFIEHLGDDKVCSSIVKSVVEVSHILSCDVIAEGVSRKSQLSQLKKLGIDAVQGFYIRRPIPFEEFIDLVTPNKSSNKH